MKNLEEKAKIDPQRVERETLQAVLDEVLMRVGSPELPIEGHRHMMRLAAWLGGRIDVLPASSPRVETETPICGNRWDSPTGRTNLCVRKMGHRGHHWIADGSAIWLDSPSPEPAQDIPASERLQRFVASAKRLDAFVTGQPPPAQVETETPKPACRVCACSYHACICAHGPHAPTPMPEPAQDGARETLDEWLEAIWSHLHGWGLVRAQLGQLADIPADQLGDWAVTVKEARAEITRLTAHLAQRTQERDEARQERDRFEEAYRRFIAEAQKQATRADVAELALEHAESRTWDAAKQVVQQAIDALFAPEQVGDWAPKRLDDMNSRAALEIVRQRATAILAQLRAARTPTPHTQQP